MNNKNQKKIIKAISSKDINKVKSIILNEANIINDNLDLVTTHTPLTFAVISGDKDIVELLLNNGANVNGTASNGESALHFGCGMHDNTMVNLLLEYKADVNAIDKDLNNGLLYILNSIDYNENEKDHLKLNENIVSVVKTLFKYNININHKNKKGLSAVDFIKKSRPLKSLMEKVRHHKNNNKKEVGRVIVKRSDGNLLSSARGRSSMK